MQKHMPSAARRGRSGVPRGGTGGRGSELEGAEIEDTASGTAIIERYKRREISVEEAIIEMYLAGESVRKVEDITEALWGTKVSPGTISKLNKKIYQHIDAQLKRKLE